MNDNERYPNPLVDARYGVAITASLGMFDTAGWTPAAAAMRADTAKKPAGVVGKIIRRIVRGKRMDRREDIDSEPFAHEGEWTEWTAARLDGAS